MWRSKLGLRMVKVGLITAKRYLIWPYGVCTWYQVPGTKYLVPSNLYHVLCTKYLVPLPPPPLEWVLPPTPRPDPLC